jgi:cytochrome c-type biogenesis protein CcmE
MSKGVQIAGGATLIALILGWYAATNLDGGIAFTYYESLADFLASPGAHQGEQSRVHGFVALRSIERDISAKQVRFAVVNDPPQVGAAAVAAGALLPVVFHGLETPDLFKDGAEVVLEGRMLHADAEMVFHAEKVFAKCPSKFEAEATEAASF